MLGPRSGGSPKLFTHLVKTMTMLRTLLDKDAAIDGHKTYPDMLRTGLDAGKFKDFRMLSRADGHVPGFEPGIV